MSSSLQGRDGYDDNNVDWMDVNNGDDHDGDVKMITIMTIYI